MQQLLTVSRLARSPLLAALPMPQIHQHWLQLLPERLGKFCNQMEQVRLLGLLPQLVLVKIRLGRT
jgi:hypothetical protein